MLSRKIRQLIPFSLFSHSAGTWTPTVASNVWYNRRTAADAAATTLIPIPTLTPQTDQHVGFKLQSLEVHFRIVTAAIDAMEAHIYKGVRAADGSLLTVSEVTSTYDTGHDTAPERIDADEHKMTLSIAEANQFWLGEDEFLFAEIVWDGSATGVIDEFQAVANGIIRL